MASNNITDLLLEASRADHAEMWHQRVCRARAAMLECQRCLDLQDDVLATDRAIRDHFTAMCQEAR